MPDLSFQVEEALPHRHSETPLLIFKLRISNRPADQSIQSILLRCQIQIETRRRTYAPGEKTNMSELFGPPEEWARNLRTMLWTHSNLVVTPFQGETVAELPVPCTFDFNVATTKYLAGLEEGEIPVCILFSGTVFYQKDEGGLQIYQIPWEKEANLRLPVKVWQEMMEIYYPNTAWLCLRRDAFDRLHRYKSDNGFTTWEQALESLLDTSRP